MKTYLISDNTIKNEGVINENVSPNLIKASIRIAQDVNLQEIIGTSLYNKLQDLIENDELVNNPKYKLLLDEYIQPFLTYITLSEIQIPIGFQNRNSGNPQNTNIETPTTQSTTLLDVKYIKQFYKDKAEFYAKLMAKYICANITSFPEYNLEINNGELIGDLKNTFSCNLNI